MEARGREWDKSGRKEQKLDGKDEEGVGTEGRTGEEWTELGSIAEDAALAHTWRV